MKLVFFISMNQNPSLKPLLLILGIAVAIVIAITVLHNLAWFQIISLHSGDITLVHSKLELLAKAIVSLLGL